MTTDLPAPARGRDAVSTTVLGTGAVGTAVASALLHADREVVVWNRTPARAEALASRGAVLADDVPGAVAASPLTLLCLTDHAAVLDVVSALPEPAEAPGPDGRVVVGLTTQTPAEAVTTTDLLERRGLAYLDVGVQTAPDDIGTPRATLLYSGSATAMVDHRATLELLGPVRWLGTDPRAAAVWDLALFGLWYDAQVGLLRALDLARASGVPIADLADAASRQLQHVVSGAEETASEVADRRYPRGPASLGEHLPLLRQLREARATVPLGEGGLAEVEQLVAALVGAGHGHLGLTALLDDRLLRP